MLTGRSFGRPEIVLPFECTGLFKSEPEYSFAKGKNNGGTRNTLRPFEYSCHFPDVILYFSIYHASE